MKELYTLILYQPIYNALVFIYNIVPGHDIGIAVILLTIIIKLLLNPLTAKSLRSQRDLQRIQPKIQELQQKFKNQKDVLSQELMKLYKSEKVNPFSSCLPLLIQLPFFIAVFSVFRNGLTDPKSLDMLYPFITNPGEINHISFGMFDLAQAKNVVLAILAGITQFFQGKMLVQKQPPKKVPGSKDESMTAAMNMQMTYIMPLFTIYISWILPAGLVLYIVVTTLLTIYQQFRIFHKKDNGVAITPAAPTQPTPPTQPS